MDILTSLRVKYLVTETVNAGIAAAQSLLFPSDVETVLGSGIASDQADLHWGKKEVVLASGASITYTLSALTDDLGRSVALVKTRLLLIRVLARTAGDYLTIGNAASNPWAAPFGGSTQTVKVHHTLLWLADKSDGFAVASGSSDQLKILNSGSNAITFSIAIVGTSA